jgi:hypothetical protein
MLHILPQNIRSISLAVDNPMVYRSVCKRSIDHLTKQAPNMPLLEYRQLRSILWVGISGLPSGEYQDTTST